MESSDAGAQRAAVFLVEFTSSKFDVAAEPENPINPIPGHSVLAWLRRALADAGFEVSEPDAEDWGWYVDAVGAAGRYLIGASATVEAEDVSGDVHWILQIHKRRTLVERLRGRARMTREDPVLAQIERRLVAEETIHGLTVLPSS